MPYVSWTQFSRLLEDVDMLKREVDKVDVQRGALVWQKSTFRNNTDDFNLFYSSSTNYVPVQAVDSPFQVEGANNDQRYTLRATSTYVGGRLFANSIFTKDVFSDNNYQISVMFKPTNEPSTSAQGAGILLRSVGTSTKTAGCLLEYSSSAPRLRLCYGTGDLSTLNFADSFTPTMTLNAASTYRMTYSLKGNTVSTTLLNLSTGESHYVQVLSPGPGSSNMVGGAFKIGLTCPGGTFHFNDFQFVTLEDIAARFICIGDSKTRGQGLGSVREAWPFQLSELNTKATTANYGGSGDKTADALAHLDQTLKRAAGKYAILNIGRNDDITSDAADAAWRVNYDAIVTKLLDDGKEIIHLLPIPETAKDQTFLTNHIKTKYKDKMLVDVSVGWNAATMLQNDGIHPSIAGASHIAATLYSYILANDLLK